MTIVLAEVNNNPVVPHASGDTWRLTCGVTLSGTYKTGGDITLAEAIEKILGEQGTGVITWLDIQGDTGGFVLQFNYATGKLKVYRTGTALKGKFEELPEEAYPAELTGAKLRIFAMGY